MLCAQDVEQVIKDEPFWYSTIELAPGRFSPGLNIPSVALTRAAMKATSIAGLTCLDVGTVEGVVPVLLARSGAREVVAYDRIDWTRKVNFVKACYGVDFQYITGMNYATFQQQALKMDVHPFDLVVFSGVLYHMFDPLGGLLRTRSMVRTGGLVIVETSALMVETMAMFFNAEGQYLPPPNYFVPSVTCLDYLLRLSRLAPVDFLKLGPGGVGADPNHIRICVVCQAVDTPQVFKSGAWDNHLITDYRDYLSWQDTATDEPPLSLKPLGNTLIRRDDGSLDLLASVLIAKSTAPTPHEVVLHLDDIN